jgi:hypothetical protein
MFSLFTDDIYINIPVKYSEIIIEIFSEDIRNKSPADFNNEFPNTFS